MLPYILYVGHKSERKQSGERELTIKQTDMNRKQKINLAVWTIVFAAAFAALFLQMLDETPQGIWERQSAFNVYMSRGMLAFITASTFFLPCILLHYDLED